MITIFNRRELFMTFQLEEQIRVREILAANQIDYLVKVFRRANHGLHPSQPQYIVYVRKADWKRAANLIRK